MLILCDSLVAGVSFISSTKHICKFGMSDESLYEPRGFVWLPSGRSGGTRTLGLMLPKHARYQLRHTPVLMPEPIDITGIARGIDFLRMSWSLPIILQFIANELIKHGTLR